MVWYDVEPVAAAVNRAMGEWRFVRLDTGDQTELFVLWPRERLQLVDELHLPVRRE